MAKLPENDTPTYVHIADQDTLMEKMQVELGIKKRLEPTVLAEKSI